VDEDVGVVVRLLREVRHAVHEPHRGGEVRQLPVADDRVSLPPPLAPPEPLLDVGVAQRCHIVLLVRIASLVPSATEMLFALGLGDEVIAVTHECDHPDDATELPVLTRSVIAEGLSASEIDTAVLERTRAGEAIYALDEELLAELEPDLIVTQALCAVCAVSYDDVVKVAARLPSHPRVISLDPHTLGEVLGDVRTLAEATDRRDAGVALVQDIASRVDRVRLAVRASPRRRVAALEWLDPVYVAGHWTPQLIEYAGGEDVLGLPGEPSERRTWDEVRAAEPEVVLVIPCGYDGPRAEEEALRFSDELASVGAEQVVAVDAAAYFSRPGPRLVEGLELLAHVLHPDRLRDAPAEPFPIQL
jgi:iron complex transport system substrate-binding protein